MGEDPIEIFEKLVLGNELPNALGPRVLARAKRSNAIRDCVNTSFGSPLLQISQGTHIEARSGTDREPA